jgi:hypothetical protein
MCEKTGGVPLVVTKRLRYSLLSEKAEVLPRCLRYARGCWGLVEVAPLSVKGGRCMLEVAEILSKCLRRACWNNLIGRSKLRAPEKG